MGKRFEEKMGGSGGASASPGPEGEISSTVSVPGTERAVAPETPPGKALRILLAEDVPINQKFLSGFLRHAGHEVVIAANGREALQELEKSSFDLVLMDVQMPVMDGLEATRRIRGNAAGTFDPLIPVVALTAFAMEGDREEFLSAGMDAYVSKPVDMRELLRTLEAVTARRRADLPGGVSRPAAQAPPVAPRLRDEDALRRCLNDREFLWSMRRDFADGLAQAHLDKLNRAVERADLAGMRGQAHAIKGALALIGAERSRDLALQLEKWPEDGGREELARLAAGFEEEIDALIELIRQAEPDAASV